MIAVDANVLVYAHRVDSPFHLPARDAVRSLCEGRSAWAIPWPCLAEFYNIVTHPRIHAVPTPVDVAIEQIDAWLESPSIVLLAEGGRHWPVLRDLVERARLQGPKIHDARVAALCLVHGVRELWTADRDFGRFPDLRVRNPLV